MGRANFLVAWRTLAKSTTWVYGPDLSDGVELTSFTKDVLADLGKQHILPMDHEKL